MTTTASTINNKGIYNPGGYQPGMLDIKRNSIMKINALDYYAKKYQSVSPINHPTYFYIRLKLPWLSLHRGHQGMSFRGRPTHMSSRHTTLAHPRAAERTSHKWWGSLYATKIVNNQRFKIQWPNCSRINLSKAHCVKSSNHLMFGFLLLTTTMGTRDS